MRYFDLHCDTISECFRKDVNLKSNSLQVDIQRANIFTTYIQCYAVWIPDSIRGEDAFKYFCNVADKFSEEVQSNPDMLLHCKAPGDLYRTELLSRHGGILTVENATALGGKIENISELSKRGVKLVSLTWNGENELGRGVRALGKTGLTDFGRKVVQELEHNGIIIDVSHASPELMEEVAQLATRPIVASHSNSRAVCDNPRNITDSQFGIIRDSGGLVGLNFLKYFLSDKPEMVTLDDIFRHAEHFMTLDGKDVLAIGSDWDGGAIEDFPLSGIELMSELYEVFLRHNYSETLVDKIFFTNADEFFTRNNLL